MGDGGPPAAALARRVSAQGVDGIRTMRMGEYEGGQRGAGGGRGRASGARRTQGFNVEAPHITNSPEEMVPPQRAPSPAGDVT